MWKTKLATLIFERTLNIIVQASTVGMHVVFLHFLATLSPTLCGIGRSAGATFGRWRGACIESGPQDAIYMSTIGAAWIIDCVICHALLAAYSVTRVRRQRLVATAESIRIYTAIKPALAFLHELPYSVKR